jgi:hypothetical protein
MRLFLIAATALAVSAPAFAADQLSASDYVKAARCAGVAEALDVDTSNVDALLKSQRRGRTPYVLNKAFEIRREAKADARRTKASDRSRSEAELSGACAAFMSNDSSQMLAGTPQS